MYLHTLAVPVVTCFCREDIIKPIVNIYTD
jgi:hypothetical protein